MLSSVHIENIALISKLDVDFTDGFTAFTGETGAGKSILIDSINMVSGARMNKDIIRTGTDSCVVSAVFSDISASAAKKIEEYGISVDDDNMLMVQRSMTLDGKSVSKVNGRTVPQSVLKNICSVLINIYGQHEFYSLTDASGHIEYVDGFADCEALKNEYRRQYETLCDIKRRMDSLEMDESEKAQRLDFLRFQIAEISSAKLSVGEEESLLEEKNRIQNFEKISESAQTAYLALYGSDKKSAYSCINTAIESIDDLSDIIPSLSEDSEKLTEYLYEIRDIAEKVIAFKPDLNDDPTKLLDDIEERLDLIYRLKKKYALPVAGIMEHFGRIQQEMNDIELSAENIEKLHLEYSEQKKKVLSVAGELTKKRKSAALEIEKKIKEQLVFLDMPGVIFKVDLRPIAQDGFGDNGADEIEFMISTNIGEPLKSMAKIASGGELSRIMLAIKSVLALNDDIPTVIFDEIDTGISGKTSHKVGINLKKLADSMQVFCVTHSAQVASLATNHYKIEKLLTDGRMQTHVKELCDAERENEIARILGGIDVTESVIATARELIEQGKKY
ncbi:MAG: DNA repair protein RecN [Ruminococcaceae bacterium]|nr:DNA repair protein RecN [Oscillospiraceae bacterium]